MRRKSITLIGAVRKYEKTRKKALEELSGYESRELKEKLAPLDEKLKLYKRISSFSTLVQVIAGTAGILMPEYAVDALGGSCGFQITKMSNGYNARRILKEAYNLIGEYWHPYVQYWIIPSIEQTILKLESEKA
ncbi:hypothetical protein COZ55_00495 [archaeon CG_4_8_14_3_um_filter_38_5]|nr:MAG: hypothetical protein COS64_03395 [archaeon CG06_land_8_20_14_3_00_37_11]PIX44305.1 MAG: hypothetical protein COZ55_00495 [archaeon CG_4_8_14_3_um_filter_38_5]